MFEITHDSPQPGFILPGFTWPHLAQARLHGFFAEILGLTGCCRWCFPPKKLPGVQLFYHFYLLGDCQNIVYIIYSINMKKYLSDSICTISVLQKLGTFTLTFYHPVTSCDSCPHQWPPHRWRHGVRNCSRGSRCRSCGPKGCRPGFTGRPQPCLDDVDPLACEPWKHHKKNMVSWNASRNRSLNIPFTSTMYIYIYVHICTYIPLVSLISHQRTIMYLYIYTYYIYIVYIHIVYIYCIYIYCIYIYIVYIYIYCIYIYIFIYIRH